MDIADALRRQGDAVTVEGVVTTRPGLLDSNSERVAIQDATAAVMVRVPADASVQVGQRLRVTGAMTTYYGAPSITSSSISVIGSATPAPLAVRGAPLAAALEWRLVTVSGRVDSVHRDGDTWRAELLVSDGSIPISGVVRSAIPSTALTEGREATIVGIVKRAYPTASDQRMAIVPRSSADIRLGGGADPGPAASPGTSSRPGEPSHPAGGPSGGGPSASGNPGPGDTGTGSTSGTGGVSGATGSSNPIVSLGDLAVHEDAMVTVGGAVTAISDALITINDGTATAIVRLAGAAGALAATIAEGDMVNATGIVKRTEAGGLQIVVDDPVKLVHLGRGTRSALAQTAADATEPFASAETAWAAEARPGSAPPFAAVVALALFAVTATLLGAVLVLDPRRRAAARNLVTIARRRLTLG